MNKTSSSCVEISDTNSTNMDEILGAIREFLISNANPLQAQRYERYFKEGYDAYGIEGTLWGRQKEYFLNKYREKLGLEGFLALGDLLVQNGKYEEASFAIHFIIPFKNEFNAQTFIRVGGWLDHGIRNWAHTDVFCSDLLSIFFAQDVVSYQDMTSWRAATSKWKRRAVPVAMLNIVKRPTDFKPLLDFIDPLMMDDERVVQQGLGWLLRDMWKKEPLVVEEFLLKWKDSSPRLIMQYATEKMTPENKARFKKTAQKSKRN